MSLERNTFGAEPSFRVGNRLVTPAANQVDDVRVEAKAMDVLLALVAAAPAVVSSAALLERVWPDVVVVDNVVYQAVAQLRRALGDEAHASRYIETVARRGYRLIAAVTSEAPNAGTPSIAVLPFVNVSADPEQAHFVDGLTIELIHRLSRLPELRVAGQISSLAYKDRPISYAEIGRTLGVRHLLEGSVRRGGDLLRITVELVGASDGFQLWSADFDRKLDDVIVIQREIADAVADALSVRLRTRSSELLGSSYKATAHVHYLRGNALFWQQTEETTERAIGELEQAVANDPAFARAWVMLAIAYGGRARRRAHTEQSLRDMANAVDSALRSEPLLWRAHAAQAWYLLSRRQFVAADAAMSFARKLRRDQESIAGPEILNYLHQVGRWNEHLDERANFGATDPALAANHDALLVLGRSEEAAAAYARFKGLSKDTDRAYLEMRATAQPTAAEADRILAGFSQSPLGRGWFGPAEPVLGALRRRLVERRDAGDRIRGEFTFGAMLAAHHGDPDLAVDLLRAEYLADGFGAYFLLWFPQLKQVRASANFKTFLIDLGLPDMWRRTGRWSDFCEPVGDDDFVCREPA